MKQTLNVRVVQLCSVTAIAFGASAAQAQALTVTTNQTNVSCNGGSNGTATANVSGGGGEYTYSWSPSGQTTATATGLAAGSYTVTVLEVFGFYTGPGDTQRSGTANVIITEPTVLNGTTNVTNVACFGGNTGAINLTPSGGAGGYSFSWGGGITTEDRTNLVAGSYSVVITDANSCTKTVPVTISQPAAPVSATSAVTTIACNGGSNGSIDLTPSGGTPGYTYVWQNGPTTEDRSGLSAGSYSVTVTDANGCTGTHTATVTQPSAITVTPAQVNVACFGGSNGVASVVGSGGTGGYTYSWTTGSSLQTITGLAAGTYTATVTDSSSCTAQRAVTITQPASAVSATTSITNVACFGGATGSIDVTPAGGSPGYTFSWAGGVTTEDRTNLAAGIYELTVEDVNGCQARYTVPVTQPTALTLTPTIVTTTCFGDADGSVSVTSSGGTGSTTARWTSGETTAAITGKPAGTYDVTFTDANGCTASGSYAVTEPDDLVVTLASSAPDGCGETPSGALSVSVAGGNGGYTYDWTPDGATGDGTASISDVAAGAYSVDVVDAKGCAAKEDYTVVFKDDAVPTAVAQTLSVVEDASLAVTLGATYSGCSELTYEVTVQPEHGTLQGTGRNLTYAPTAGYVGSDSFSFRVVVSEDIASAAAVVSLTVTEKPEVPTEPGTDDNTAPVATAMTVTTAQATAVTFTLSATDAEGDDLTYRVVISPQFGTLSGEPPLLTYTPTASNAYQDNFWFVANDGKATSASARVIVEVGERPGTGTKPPTNGGNGEDDNDDGCSALAISDVASLSAALVFAATMMKRRRR